MIAGLPSQKKTQTPKMGGNPTSEAPAEARRVVMHAFGRRRLRPSSLLLLLLLFDEDGVRCILKKPRVNLASLQKLYYRIAAHIRKYISHVYMNAIVWRATHLLVTHNGFSAHTICDSAYMWRIPLRPKQALHQFQVATR